MIRRLALASFSLLQCLLASVAFAQADFPSKPIRLVVGFVPGGSTDVLARALAQQSRAALGQEVLVVNRPGASGSIAINEVIAAAPDGYTLGIAPTSAFTLAFHFTDIAPDLLDRIDPLLMVGRQRVGMVVKADSPHSSLRDLMQFASKNPGKVSIGVPGTGTSVEIFAREIARQGSAEVVVVPFKGDADVAAALLGSQIVAGSLSTAGFATQVRAKKMRVLASYQAERFDMAPNVPTLEEMGYGLTATSIQFAYGPKGMPLAVASRLVAEFSKATRSKLFVDIAGQNDLYDKAELTRDALNASLLKDRATNRVLIEKIGMKKQ